ncbi:MAG: glycosyltransferase family 39 protein [Acidobacteriia bacterium]|nr:glycosyltransferase family 39 protein [Terriglobia bacterium]
MSIYNRWTDTLHSILAGTSLSKRFQLVFLMLILWACIGVRVFTLKAPALDRTFWKEIDYITISTNYWHHGMNFLRPEINWPADPHRVTAMEFPLVPYSAAFLYSLFGFNVFSVRLITLCAFLVMIVYVFLLVRRELGPIAGLVSGWTCAILPLYHPFGKLLFSDPLMIALCVVAMFHWTEWVESQKRRDWWIALVSFTLAVALKLEPLYLLLVLAWVMFRRHHFTLREYAPLVKFALISLILPVLWYSFAYHLARTSIDVFGIFGGLGHTGHDKFQSLQELTDPAWYHIMAQRLLAIVAGKVGLILLVAGLLVVLSVRKTGLFFVYLGSVMAYFGIVAEGQIDAPYRQLAIIPVFSVFIALGAVGIVCAIISMLPKSSSGSTVGPRSVLILCISGVLVLGLAYQRRADILFRDSSRPVDPIRWELAQAIKHHATASTKLIAAGEYSLNRGGNDLSPVLYYYAGVQGWTIQRADWNVDEVAHLIDKGATLFSAVEMSREPDSKPFLDAMRNKYATLHDAPDELLLDLTRPAGH